MRSDSALSAMHDAVALWQVGEASAADVIYAACHLLTAGVDSPILRMLAALPVREADYEVNELIEAVMSEVGLPHHSRDSAAANQAAVRATAARLVAGDLTPSYLAAWANSEYWLHELELASRLTELDHCYCEVEYTDLTVEDIDALVIAEAQRIISLS
ncbi:hypothetical protein [Kibdelosporangium aridum]|uniref:hypothetical protein n=1 Tax=Kibdelosporangium aridum TaxID=2030 RepID=UPI0035EBC538